MTVVWLLAAAAAALAAHALPQQPFQHNHLDPLKHLSAISPFYIPARAPDPLPAHCTLDRVSVLVRHSAILGNDDEWEQAMGPFVRKVEAMDGAAFQGEWAFLRDWETPIVESRLEELSERGRRDAKALGKYLRGQYASLFPPPGRGFAPTYKVWTASSSRDVESAEAYIKGAFPKHQAGDDGHGDGEVVQLVRVPNKAAEWDRSLTPHKACAAFEKESSLKPATQWLGVYAPDVRARIAAVAPHFAAGLVDDDILAMQMLCGYETIAQGDSRFCHVFSDDEWRAFEYHQDVRYHYMLGYGQPLAPYLGMPWAKTAAHLLAGKDAHDVDALKHKLPPPRLPPNATHTQRLHVSFTHRESPGFVAVFLNLYNGTEPFPATRAPPLDHVVAGRAWRTSHLVPFLGHVALERFTCGEDAFVRAVVNGKHEVMGGCDDGVDRACKWRTFEAWVEARAERWADWESVCNVE